MRSQLAFICPCRDQCYSLIVTQGLIFNHSKNILSLLLSGGAVSSSPGKLAGGGLTSPRRMGCRLSTFVHIRIIVYLQSYKDSSKLGRQCPPVYRANNVPTRPAKRTRCQRCPSPPAATDAVSTAALSGESCLHRAQWSLSPPTHLAPFRSARL